jgi:hypothetical protein
MTTKTIKFHVLDVGQGACNYVEIIDEDDIVTHNMLIDLGTNSKQAIAHDNLQWLRDKIIDNGGYLDVLILTHGDTDHYNMIAKILPAFGPPAHNQIGMIRYGGPSWRYNQGRLITTLTGYAAQIDGSPFIVYNIASFTPSQTGYDGDGEYPYWTPIWEADADDAAEPKLQLFIANTPHPQDGANLFVRQTKMNAEAVNTKSVVTALEWNNHWYVATGDATATTLAELNDILAEAQEDDFPATFMLTLPHHGSRKTTYDLKKADDLPDLDARLVITDFLNLFPPMSMSVSAGEKNHHHPSMYLLRQFTDNLKDEDTYWSDPTLNDGSNHFLTSWIDLGITPVYIDPAWPPANTWLYATTKTSSNVYGTFYFKNAQYNLATYPQYVAPPIPVAAQPPDHVDIANIPMGRNWEFRMVNDELSVESTDNAARARAARADFAAIGSAPPASFVAAPGRDVRASMNAIVAPRRQDDAPPRPLQPAAPSLRGLRATE